MNNKLISIAKKFESKLGTDLQKNSEETLPKKLKKIVKAEQKLQKKIKRQKSATNRIINGVTVKTSTGRVPGIYLICNECQGQGKLAVSNADVTIKLASAEEDLTAVDIKTCAGCKGKRVIKTADIRKCSEEQVRDRAQYIKDKEDSKAMKKAEKKKKKAAKAIAKAEQKRIEAENPMAFKAMKLKKKAEKKAKKAAKKAMKAIDKAQRAEAKL